LKCATEIFEVARNEEMVFEECPFCARLMVIENDEVNGTQNES